MRSGDGHYGPDDQADKCEEGSFITVDQWIITGLLIALLCVLASERIRYEVAACLFLAAGFLTGVVPAQSVFSGFSHPAVITVAEILILVAALQTSPLMRQVSDFILLRVRGPHLLLATVCMMGAGLSVFMNNIGAMALMMPLVIAVAAKSGLSQQFLLIPLSFATLLGGTCSLIGTPANLIVSDAYTERTGLSFGFFDFAVLGLPALIMGLLAIFLFAQHVFKPRIDNADRAFSQADHTTERLLVTESRIPAGSGWIGLRPDEPPFDEQITIASIIRHGRYVFGRAETQKLREGDTLYLQAPAGLLEQAERAGNLVRTAGAQSQMEHKAVVLPQSVILGSRIASLESFSNAGIVPVAVATPRRRLEGRFDDLQLAVGDVIYLRGPEESLFAVAEQSGLLLLQPPPGNEDRESDWSVPAAFLGGVALAISGLLAPELAFGTSVILLAALGKLDIARSLHRLNWPILVLLAAMIPLGSAVETTGAAEVIAGAIVGPLTGHGSLAILLAILLSAVVITPFVNNASTAIVLAPVALEIALSTGLDPRIAMIAVGVGVSLDFLTPFGHHNNTIAMSVGGYRFTDFARLGLPVLIAAVTAILLTSVWLS